MKKICKKLLVLIIIVNFLGTIFGGTTAVNNSKATMTNAPIQKDRLQVIKEKSVINVAAPLNDVSYFFIDTNTKNIVGIEADIINEIARRLGINRIETNNVSFSNLLEKLNTDSSIDIASGGIFIIPEREKYVAFTQPLYKVSEAIVVPTFSPINFKSDLRNAVVGVQKGTIYVELAERWKQSNIVKDVIVFENMPELLKAINEQKIQAGIVDSIVLKYSLLKDTKFGLRLLKDYTPEISENVAIAMRKSDITLLNAFNEKINEMRADGTMYTIMVENGLNRENWVGIQ